jgi:hypothetical protein
VSLALDDEALPVLALPPPVPASVVMFQNLFDNHALDLRVVGFADHHEALFGDDDLFDREV